MLELCWCLLWKNYKSLGVALRRGRPMVNISFRSHQLLYHSLEIVILDPPRKARARSPNLQRTGLIGSVTSRDVTKSVNIVLARWFHFFDAKPKNVHFWCPKVGSRYRPLEWLIQLTSIFFRVPPNLSVKLPVDQQRCDAVICCTGKSDYNPKKKRSTQNYILLFLHSPA